MINENYDNAMMATEWSINYIIILICEIRKHLKNEFYIMH